jgi:glycosyltransferase involved in cell wall biosynthesis
MRANLNFDRSGPNRRFRAADLQDMFSAPSVPAARPPRVLLAGGLTAQLSPGGGETQLAATCQALVSLGVEARLWRPWEDSLGGADCLHLFGSLREHQSLIDAAHARGARVALSTIAWFDLGSLWRESRSLGWRVAACGRFLARAAFPAIDTWRRRLYQSADVLLPNSQAEAAQLMKYFGVPAERIHVVPNGADPRFANADPRPFASLAGGRNFVLYPGRIEPRKNQLGFLRAMRGAQVPIVILGDVVPGHEHYLEQCRRAADEQVRFVPRLRHDDPRLASAYAACGCLALASWYETPGLVALEAAMSGTPLVLPKVGAAREYFDGWAEYVIPSDQADIRRKVVAALSRGRSLALARLTQRRYSWRVAAEATREAYEKIL